VTFRSNPIFIPALLTAIARRLPGAVQLLLHNLQVASARLCFALSPRLRPNGPAALIWATQFYPSASAPRARELADCLQANCRLRWLDQILLFCDSCDPPPFAGRSPITALQISGRLSYASAFRQLLSLPAPPGSVVILSNSDVFLTDSLAELASVLGPNDFITLTRYEPQSSLAPFRALPFVAGLPSDTQDTWMIQRDSINRLPLEQLDRIALGTPHCDTSLAAIALDAGFRVWNPCLSVTTVHHHGSEVRTWTPADTHQLPRAYPRTCYLAQLAFRLYWSPQVLADPVQANAV
jgi:hypothetical protein